MHNSILYHRALDLKVKYMVYMHNKHNLKKKGQKNRMLWIYIFYYMFISDEQKLNIFMIISIVFCKLNLFPRNGIVCSIFSLFPFSPFI